MSVLLEFTLFDCLDCSAWSQSQRQFLQYTSFPRYLDLDVTQVSGIKYKCDCLSKSNHKCSGVGLRVVEPSEWLMGRKKRRALLLVREREVVAWLPFP